MVAREPYVTFPRQDSINRSVLFIGSLLLIVWQFFESIKFLFFNLNFILILWLNSLLLLLTLVLLLYLLYFFLELQLSTLYGGRGAFLTPVIFYDTGATVDVLGLFGGVIRSGRRLHRNPLLIL